MFAAVALGSLVPTLLLLLLSRLLWGLRWSSTRDRSSMLPLPHGSMGWPLVGETLHWLLQVIKNKFDHNFSHNLPCYEQTLSLLLHAVYTERRMCLFSRDALETYLSRLQDVVKCAVAQWCSEPGSVDAYDATRSLTFRVAMRALLGLRLEEQRLVNLSKTFEELMNNLFSLPVDAPLSGLRKGKKARDVLHAAMESIIEEKLKRQQGVDEYCDAFDYMLSGALENGYNLTMQELKERAVELIFAAHSTTASAATSLILQLMRHPDVVDRLRAELESEGLMSESEKCVDEGEACPEFRTKPQLDKTPCSEEGHRSQTHVPYLSLEKLNQLGYLDCVVKEVLRYLPPVSGGYRTVLQTFELDGYQIPKGWSVMYSIRDTHETSAAYQNPELFDPDRFSAERDESKSSRFSYVPFGGGVRLCVGRELAMLVLKTLCLELLATADFTLATETYPRMQTVPIVHPVNGLHVKMLVIFMNMYALL
uniref:Cytochrome P450, family 26, subfamily C, polypeptide 1 n=1 Tax=Astyanax mexicanus TaxID=7994 RepID=A0A8B9LPE6_ASTMX